MDGINVDWLTQILQGGADAYATVKNADALAHQQKTEAGQVYTMGQFAQGGGGIPPGLLLIGGAVLLIMFLKD